jgi:plastocyanin
MRKSWALLIAAIILAACSDASGPEGVRSVSVSAAFTTVQAGQPVQLTATATDASGSVVQNASLTWSSSAPAVATVNGTGLVSTLTGGQVTITASAGTVEGSLGLTVTPGPSGIATVTMPGLSFIPFTTTINAGGTVRFEFPASAHNVIFARITGAPTDIQATSNRTVPLTFPVAGTFPYDCTLHPGMSGVVIVR